ncbi:hypothetical protein VTJ49DRAFT_6678 [Mycothermus thermophilus]|uniref:Nucleolar protein 16 n=1 Tax=Humicola insolens TaxID=85995 RepID=A0ABR3VIM7_HUMIN
MGRELQKRKRRSSRPKIKMPNRRKKPLNPRGNDIIAKAWYVPSQPDCALTPSQTLSQNYSRFGLVAKLGKATGGTAPSNKSVLNPSTDPLAPRSADQGLLQVREVQVERDAEGRITRVLRNPNPLNDPLNELDSDSETEGKKKQYDEWSGFQGEDDSSKPEVLRALEREASRPVEKTVRHQSEREIEWLQRLVDRHGDDTAAMARDMKLNPMQQTAADIRKRLKKAGLLSA